MFRVITPPTTEPVTVAEAKAFLRVDVSDDDTLIESLIPSAREYVEHISNQSWASQTVELTFHAFPGAALELEQGPVTSVTSVKYIDANGAEQTLAGGAYVAVVNSIFPVIAWPATYAVQDAVKVRYVVTPVAVPKAIRAAILEMLAHLYENRESAGEIPESVRRLASTVKVY